MGYKIDEFVYLCFKRGLGWNDSCEFLIKIAWELVEERGMVSTDDVIKFKIRRIEAEALLKTYKGYGWLRDGECDWVYIEDIRG